MNYILKFKLLRTDPILLHQKVRNESKFLSRVQQTNAANFIHKDGFTMAVEYLNILIQNKSILHRITPIKIFNELIPVYLQKLGSTSS